MVYNNLLNRRGILPILVLLLLMAANLLAQTGNGSISGRVSDSAGAVLQGARVTLPGGYLVSSDSLGQFNMIDLAPGSYQLTVSYIGFDPFTTTVTVTSGQAAKVEAVLKVASTATEMTVYADRQFGEAESVNRQRVADNIVNVLTEEVILSLPNANIADAVGRMPGVTLERDEGEGKYVQIRGTEPRLTNVTVDGISIPSPEVAVKQVKLDSIPADIIDSVVVNKTLLPNQEADAIGGSVDLVTKTAGDQLYLQLRGLAGYSAIQGDTPVSQFSATVGQRFGATKRFGVIVSGGWDYNGRGIDDIEPSPTANSVVPHYDSIDLRQYRYDRTRWGFGGGLDYKLGENSGLYSHFLFSDFKDSGNKWTYTLQDNDVPKYSTSRRLPDYAIGSLAIGGHHVFTSSWFSWNIASAYGSQQAAAGNPGAAFKFKGDSNCYYDPQATITVYRPQWNWDCNAPGSDVYNPDMWKLKTLDLTAGSTSQVNLQGSGSYAKNYRWGSHFGTLEFGVWLRNSHKGQDATSPEYDPNGTLKMTQFLSNNTDPQYYGGSYQRGPITNWNLITSYFYANPGAFTLDETATHLNTDQTNYNLNERIGAGYIMDSMDFGRFRIVGGVRLEGTLLNTTGYHVTLDSDGNYVSTEPVKANNSYVSPMPSVQVRYRITDDSDARISYSRGISRPNPYDTVPYIVEDQSTNPYTYTIGNPNLKPEYANNYDILYEHYLKPFGLVQGGFFYKQLSSPIYYVNNPNETTGPYAGYQVSTIINGSNANLWGFEVSYIQQLTFLPGLMKGLGISANYTWTTSQANGLPGRSDMPALQRQAPNTWNISPTYDRGRLSVRVGMTYNGSSIFAYQYQAPTDGSPDLGPKGPAGDNYLYSHFQLDCQGSYNMGKGLLLIVSGLNLNNEVFGFYNGSPQYVVQREYYKPTIMYGLQWTPSFKGR